MAQQRGGCAVSWPDMRQDSGTEKWIFITGLTLNYVPTCIYLQTNQKLACLSSACSPFLPGILIYKFYKCRHIVRLLNTNPLPSNQVAFLPQKISYDFTLLNNASPPASNKTATCSLLLFYCDYFHCGMCRKWNRSDSLAWNHSSHVRHIRTLQMLAWPCIIITGYLFIKISVASFVVWEGPVVLLLLHSQPPPATQHPATWPELTAFGHHWTKPQHGAQPGEDHKVSAWVTGLGSSS